LFVYFIPPIDFWFGWHDPELLIYEYERHLKFEEYFRLGKETARKLGWAGDVRDGPYVCGVADPNMLAFNYLIAWKQENNGDCVVVSPHRLPHLEAGNKWLEVPSPKVLEE
jgi:hypothetical protein